MVQKLGWSVRDASQSSDPISANHLLNKQEILAARTELRSKPLQINLELMGLCNIVPPCLFCSGKNFGHNYPPLNIAYLAKYADFLNVCEKINEDSFGEPLMHPMLPVLAKQITDRGQRFTFVSNGLLLNKRRADQLVSCGDRLGMHISFNAASADTYFKLHGKSFDLLVDNVVYYVSAYQQAHAGQTPDLTLTFIVMRINRHEVTDFLKLARQLGVKSLLAPLHNRPSVPIGYFGYDFVYLDEILSPSEYASVAAEVTAAGEEIYSP
jgi:MoaA/NifB/PqqE/SkfB family radical SAM enzyme